MSFAFLTYSHNGQLAFEIRKTYRYLVGLKAETKSSCKIKWVQRSRQGQSIACKAAQHYRENPATLQSMDK